MIKNKQINLIINTPAGRDSKIDDSYIRMLAIRHKIPYMTTIAAAKATVAAIRAAQTKTSIPKSLQEYHNA